MFVGVLGSSLVLPEELMEKMPKILKPLMGLGVSLVFTNGA